MMQLAGDAILMEQVQNAVDEVFAAPEHEEYRDLIRYARRAMEEKGLIIARN